MIIYPLMLLEGCEKPFAVGAEVMHGMPSRFQWLPSGYDNRYERSRRVREEVTPHCDPPVGARRGASRGEVLVS